MSAKNSTNVRISTMRAGLAALGAVSPALAGDLAARMFFRTPPRRDGRGVERAVFGRGTRRDVSFRDHTLATWSWGDGPAVLLVHGWGGRAGQLARFVDPLVAAGFRVVAFDAPGHGRSTGSSTSLTEVSAAIEAVAAAAGPLHAVVGHSMGGAAALLSMSRGLPAARAVLVGPPSDAAVWFERFSDTFALRPAVAVAARRAAEARAGASLTSLDAERVAVAVSAPVLVIHDRDDREVALADGARLAAALPAGELLVTEGLGHRRILATADVVAAAVHFVAGGDAESRPRPRARGARALERSLDAELFQPSLRWSA
jgi:pimeloyl-ACP methyl ester carboxylesterase